MWYLLRLILFVTFFHLIRCDKCDYENIQTLCLDQESCDGCLAADECCHWCYDQSYEGRKCSTLNQLSACSQDKIEINQKSYAIVSEDGDKSFTKTLESDNFEDIIQIKPQIMDVNLRLGQPINISFTYKPYDDYPLDLYYLGDLSASMKDNLEVFKTLGTDLPSNLSTLTSNYKLAYGSFMDKTGMPFYFTDPQKYSVPCQDNLDVCDTGYLFKHRLNFTQDTEIFTQKILNSKITANLDDLDGALDAIWQILNCPKEMGWSENSRKIILLPTDSLLHMAGDGLLVGAVLKLREECLLDIEGNHREPLKYDFPSVGELDRLLKMKKVNIIFAVKNKYKLDYYRNLTRDLVKDSAFVGELETKSANILDLITQGFYNFARQVSFFINTTQYENIDVKFFADCENHGIMNETATCYNVEKNSVNFKTQITLNSLPTTSNNGIIYIEEKNINEKIALRLKYPEPCKCKNYSGLVKSCQHGDFACGECHCEEEWTGELCDESCEESDSDVCRFELDGTISFICSGNGDCKCGKCDCSFPYIGKYCQYECPVAQGQICSGPNQGTCSEGKCTCLNGFTGDDCSCSSSTDNCKLLDVEEVCSNNGDCVCNKCECNEGFSGDYCEVNKLKEKNTLCDNYKEIVENAFVNGTWSTEKNKVAVKVEKVEDIKKIKKCENSASCTSVVFQGSRRCALKFCYYVGEDGAIHLPGTEECILTATIQAVSWGAAVFLAVFVGGLLFIALTKFRLYRLEQAEYKRFQNEQKNFKEMNPIYKDPVTTYRNPLRND